MSAIIKIIPEAGVDMQTIARQAFEDVKDFTVLRDHVRYLGSGDIVAHTIHTQPFARGFVIKSVLPHETRWYFLPNMYKEVFRELTATQSSLNWNLSDVASHNANKQSSNLFLAALCDQVIHYSSGDQLRECVEWCHTELKRRDALIVARQQAI